jgi:hypothetical protein
VEVVEPKLYIFEDPPMVVESYSNFGYNVSLYFYQSFVECNVICF